MKRFMLVLAVAVAFAFTGDDAAANDGFEQLICDLFGSLCDDDSSDPFSSTETPELHGLDAQALRDFASLPEGGTSPGAAHPTPEPSGALLFAAGLGLVGATTRRRRQG